MHRFATRFAGIAVCAVALAACASGKGDKAAANDTPPDIRMSPQNSLATNVNDALAQAQILRNKGDFAGATRIMAQLMLAQPDDARVVGEYGKLLAQESRSADAVNFLRRAVELQPSDWTYYSALGVSYDQLGDHDSARSAYEHALALKPGTAVVLNNYAMSRMLAGDATGAHFLMAKAQATGEVDPRIAKNIAMLDEQHPVAPVAVALASPVKPTTQPAPLAIAAPSRVTPSANHIVMQDIPTDDHAGPVDKKKTKIDKRHFAAAHHVQPKLASTTAKPAKLVAEAKPAKPVLAAKPTKIASGSKPAKTADITKPAKKTKASDGIPALRQTADASKP